MSLSRVINCKSTNYYLSSTIFLVFLCICRIFCISYDEFLPRWASSVLRRKLIAHRGEMAVAFTTPDSRLGLLRCRLFETIVPQTVSLPQYNFNYDTMPKA